MGGWWSDWGLGGVVLLGGGGGRSDWGLGGVELLGGGGGWSDWGLGGVVLLGGGGGWSDWGLGRVELLGGGGGWSDWGLGGVELLGGWMVIRLGIRWSCIVGWGWRVGTEFRRNGNRKDDMRRRSILVEGLSPCWNNNLQS